MIDKIIKYINSHPIKIGMLLGLEVLIIMSVCTLLIDNFYIRLPIEMLLVVIVFRLTDRYVIK